LAKLRSTGDEHSAHCHLPLSDATSRRHRIVSFSSFFPHLMQYSLFDAFPYVMGKPAEKAGAHAQENRAALSAFSETK
jgi:hypothetical protein